MNYNDSDKAEDVTRLSQYYQTVDFVGNMCASLTVHMLQHNYLVHWMHLSEGLI